MSRRTGLILIVLLVFGLQSAFAQYHLPEPVFHEDRVVPARDLLVERSDSLPRDVLYLWDYIPAHIHEPMIFLPLFTLASAASSDADAPEIPHNIRNNRYYLESIRLTKLAQNAYAEGDYDASNEYAAEAVRYAQLSDEYVEAQLKIKETNDTIAAARERLEWADSSGAAEENPAEYAEAQGFFAASIAARSAEEWDVAIEAANNVINILAYAEAPASTVEASTVEAPDGNALPATYTVRTWASSRDCLWNIAGRPWAYGDPFKWKLIYDANKSKMPETGNPDLIHPGMVLDIPSINDEARQGMWEADKTY